MTTAYTSLLGLALPVTGELSGTWGDVVNNSITSLLDSAVAGTTNVSTDGDVTLTTTTGAANTAREAILLFSGARTALRTVTAPAQSKVYTVINATTGGYAVKLVGAGPTTGLTIPNGASAVVAWNGSDFVEIGTSSIGNLTVNGNLTVTGTSTLTGAITNTAGTANGVAYLNGSKVLTTGSALVFDGTNLGVGTTGNLNYSARLKVLAPSNQYAAEFYGSGSNNASIIALTNDSSIAGIGGVVSNLVFYTGGITERARIDGSGNLLVGTTTQSGSAKLTLQQSTDNSAGGLSFVATNGSGAIISRTTDGSFTFRNGGAIRFDLDESGRAGFGTQGTTADRLCDMSFQGASLDAGANGFGLVLNPTFPNTITSTIFNLYSGPNLTSGTTVANVYGHYLEAINATGSTITGNRWGLYQAGSSDKNYFAGNIGLGVTTSAWGSSYKVIQFPASTYGGGALVSDNGSPNIVANAYNDGTNWKYVTTGDYATIYQSRSGQHQWFNATTGTAGNNISFTQAMTLSASGNLGIGTTSPAYRLSLAIPAAQNTNTQVFTATDSTYCDLNIFLNRSTTLAGSSAILDTSAGALVFKTVNTERARFDNVGNFMVGTPTASAKTTVFTYSGDLMALISGNGSTGVVYYAGTTSGTFAYFVNGSSSGVGSITQTNTSTAYNTSTA